MLTNKDPAGSFAPFYVPSKMKMIGCTKLTIKFFVDPEVVQQTVPSMFEVRKYPNGKSIFVNNDPMLG